MADPQSEAAEEPAVDDRDDLIAALATMIDLWVRHCGKWSVRDQVDECRVVLNKARGRGA